MEDQPVILVVDDNRAGQELLKKILSREGYQLYFADTGRSALERAAETIPDLILLDIMLPDLNGFEVCRSLRSTPDLAEIPVMMVTALADRESLLQGIEAGADDFITKPFDTAEIKARVRTITRLNRYRALLNERARADQAARESEEKYRALVENLNEVVFNLAGDHTFTYISPLVLELFGYHDYEVVGKNIAQFIYPEDLGMLRECIEGASVSLQPLEFRFVARDGGLKYVSASVHRQSSPGGISGWTGILNDITAQKQTQQALSASQRLVDIGVLAAGIAHEIKSPLQVITMSSEGLVRRIQKNKFTPEDTIEQLNLIRRNSLRIAEIAQSLLNYTRSSSSELSEYHFNDIIRDALLLIEHQLRSWADIEVVSQLAADVPTLHCNWNQITQVVINLLTNARDAMPGGGVITLATEYDPQQECVRMTVADRGSGIPADLQNRIFEPFFTTKPLGQGTGLGLSIIKNIVEKHGGRIDFRTSSGGTVFIVEFPTHI